MHDRPQIATVRRTWQRRFIVPSSRPAAGSSDEPPEDDGEDRWDELEPAPPEAEPPWEIWDPLDDEPAEPEPGDFWSDPADDDE